MELILPSRYASKKLFKRALVLTPVNNEVTLDKEKEIFRPTRFVRLHKACQSKYVKKYWRSCGGDLVVDVRTVIH